MLILLVRAYRAEAAAAAAIFRIFGSFEFFFASRRFMEMKTLMQITR